MSPGESLRLPLPLVAGWRTCKGLRGCPGSMRVELNAGLELLRVLAQLPGTEGVAVPPLRSEHPMRPEPSDWESLKALYEDLQRTGSVEGTPEHFDLVRRVARQVAIPDDEAERELQHPDGLSRLIAKTRKRIREGSQRLMRAMYDARQRIDAGDPAGARQVLDEALADEVVPFYREIAK